MSSTLDMSLEEIIKTQKASRPRTQRPRSSTGPTRTTGAKRNAGPTRNGRNSRDKKPYQAGAQQYKATPVAPLHTSVIRQSAPDGSKIQVSNLDHRVTSEDLKYFLRSFSETTVFRLYIQEDELGKTDKRTIPCNAFNDIAIDTYQSSLTSHLAFPSPPVSILCLFIHAIIGRAMKIELIVAPGAVQAAVPQAQGQRAANNSGQQKRATSGNRGNGRGRGGRARGGSRPKKENKTADQLDAEMTDYMQVDA
ncbi:hypothetical protein BGZ46_007400 [Entomortierella lignicola]|nr:hypothetical protein BGZ46_007400 [Entomortierella lignicola]